MVKWIEISEKLRGEMEGWLRDAYPEEGCGILMGSVEGDGVVVTGVLGSENVAEEGTRARRYVVEPRVILEAERGGGMVGVFHSHPDCGAVPSAEDGARAWEGYVYVIVRVSEGGVEEMRGWEWFGGTWGEVEVRV